MLDFSNYKFRCYNLGNLMTEPKGGQPAELYRKALEAYESAKKKLLISLEETETKISEFPEEKREQAGYKKLVEKKQKLDLDIQTKLHPLIEEVNALKANKDKVVLSDTCIKELIKIYISAKTGRRYNLENKYLSKGIGVEDESITLISKVLDAFYEKNTVRVENDYLSGECDINPNEDNFIIDAKSSWDIFTHQPKTVEDTVSIYWWQGKGYSILYKKNHFILAYCLIDTPSGLIEDEKKRALYKIGSDKADTEAYKEWCENIERNSTYSDIPDNERVILKSIRYQQGDDFEKRLYERLDMCRIWLNDYAKSEAERVQNHLNALNFQPDVSIDSAEPDASPVASSVDNPSENDIPNPVDEKVENVTTVNPTPEPVVVAPAPAPPAAPKPAPAPAVPVSAAPAPVQTAQLSKQTDLEESISEIKGELKAEEGGENALSAEEIKLIDAINKLKTLDEVKKHRTKIKTEMAKYTSVKEAIIAKRDSFMETPVEKEIVPPQNEPKQPVAAPPVSAAPAPVVAETESITIEKIVSLIDFSTEEEKKAFIDANVSYCKENPDSKDYLTTIAPKNSAWIEGFSSSFTKQEQIKAVFRAYASVINGDLPLKNKLITLGQSLQ